MLHCTYITGPRNSVLPSEEGAVEEEEEGGEKESQPRASVGGERVRGVQDRGGGEGEGENWKLTKQVMTELLRNELKEMRVLREEVKTMHELRQEVFDLKVILNKVVSNQDMQLSSLHGLREGMVRP